MSLPKRKFSFKVQTWQSFSKQVWSIFITSNKLRPSLDISSSVETIECEGFSFCDNLKEFLFFEGITTIKESALYGCNSLESIRLPKSLKTIECEAFEDCESLKTIYVVKGSKYSNLPEGVKVKEY